MRGWYLVSVWLHVLAAMTWVGGMVLLVIAIMPYVRRQDAATRDAFLAWFGRRFRQITWACFGVLAATGTFNLWVRGVRIGDVLRSEWRETTWGQLLVVKLVLVVAAVAMTIAHERLMTPSVSRWSGRSLLVVGLAIVWIAVLLVRTI
jgi:uncharacterized membrane protein